MSGRIIGLVGQKGCGKSTLAHALESLCFIRAPLAGPLKSMLHALLAAQNLDAQGIDDMLNGHAKEIPTRLLAGHTPRHAMQTLGTEWGRQLIAHDFWLDVWSRGVPNGVSVVVDDVRFTNEASMLRSRGGQIIRIVRQKQVEADDTHVSETESVLITPNLTITNFEHEPKAMLQQLREYGVI